MTLGNRALAIAGVAVSCAGLLVGLIGAEQLLTLHTTMRAGTPMTAIVIGMAELATASLLAVGGLICLYGATRHPQSAVAHEASARERHPHGPVTM